MIIAWLIILTITFSGCRKKDTTKFHYYTRVHRNYQKADIIYEIYSNPSIIIENRAYWKKDDIVLNIKYGWNEERVQPLFSDLDGRNYKVVCFAIYLYLDRKAGIELCDDYKNFNKGILIGEIEKEVFLSDYYKAKLGKDNFFYADKPTFSPENEGIKLKLTPEYIKFIEESTDNNAKEFHFSFVNVYYNFNDNTYALDFFGKNDGIYIIYFYSEDTNLVHMSAF